MADKKSRYEVNYSIDNQVVYTISPFEFIFPLLGIGYRENGIDTESYEPKRLGDLKIWQCQVLHGQQNDVVFLDEPTLVPKRNSSDFKKLVDLIAEHVFKEGVAAERRDEFIIVDNPIAMAPYIDNLKLVNEENIPAHNEFNGKIKNEDSFPFFWCDKLYQSKRVSNDEEKSYYDQKTYMNRSIPLHFVIGCGYRTAVINIALLKHRFSGDGGLKTSDIIPYQNSFSDKIKLRRVASAMDNLANIYVKSAFVEDEQHYVYMSMYDPTNPDSAINLPTKDNNLPLSSEKKSWILDKYIPISEHVGSRMYHAYADTLTKAIYDTYFYFGLTHSSNSSSSLDVGNSFKLYLGSFYYNIRNYTNRMINDDIRFPCEDRLVVALKGNGREETYVPLSKIKTTKEEMESFINNTKMRMVDSVIEAVINSKIRNEQADEDTENPFNVRSKIDTRNFGGSTGKYMHSVLCLDEVLKTYNMADKEDDFLFTNMVKSYAGHAGFVIVRTKGLFNEECSHVMGMRGVLHANVDSSTRVTKKQAIPEFFALPFFFIQYMQERGYLARVEVLAVGYFLKKFKPNLNNRGTTQYKNGGFPLLQDLTNFALTPYISTYERMYSVMYADMIYSSVRAKLGGMDINFVCNHSAKEIGVFSSKDTFGNSKKSIEDAMNFRHDSSVVENSLTKPGFFVPAFANVNREMSDIFIKDDMIDNEDYIEPQKAASAITMLEQYAWAELGIYIEDVLVKNGTNYYSEKKKIF